MSRPRGSGNKSGRGVAITITIGLTDLAYLDNLADQDNVSRGEIVRRALRALAAGCQECHGGGAPVHPDQPCHACGKRALTMVANGSKW
jgi:hypothetical protein